MFLSPSILIERAGHSSEIAVTGLTISVRAVSA